MSRRKQIEDNIWSLEQDIGIKRYRERELQDELRDVEDALRRMETEKQLLESELWTVEDDDDGD